MPTRTLHRVHLSETLPQNTVKPRAGGVVDKHVTEVREVTESKDSSREGDADQDLWEQGKAEFSRTTEGIQGLSNSPPNIAVCQIRWAFASPMNPYLKEQGRHQPAPCQASLLASTHRTLSQSTCFCFVSYFSLCFRSGKNDSHSGEPVLYRYLDLADKSWFLKENSWGLRIPEGKGF